MVSKSLSGLRNQKGYATVLTLILFSALGLSLFAVFNSGQIVTHKLKLQNAVDAATYSSVNVVAREMNYMAYTNRAMVANQLAIGQMVALSSWSKQMVELIGNLDKLGRFVTYISAGTINLASITNAIKKAVELGDRAADALIKFSIPFERRANKALSKSQGYVHGASAAIAIEVFKTTLVDNNKGGQADDVIKSAALIRSAVTPTFLRGRMPGYEKIKKVEVPNPPNPSGYNPSGSANTERLRDFDNYKKVITGSADDFVGTKSPNGRSYKLFDIDIAVINVWAKKKGGNKLEQKVKNNKYTWDWSAMDTLSFYYEWGCFWCSTHEIALGWGGAHATNGYQSRPNVYDSYYQNSGQVGGGLTQAEQNELSNLSAQVEALETQLEPAELAVVAMQNEPGFDEGDPADLARIQPLRDNVDAINNEISIKTAQIGQLSNKGSDGFGSFFGGGIKAGWGDARSNRKSSRKAAREYKDNKVGGSSPLLSFHKFNNSRKFDDTGASFMAVISKNEDGVRTRNKVIKDHANKTVPIDGSFNVEKEGNMVGGKMYAAAKAQVYFARSPDDPSKPGRLMQSFNRGDGSKQEFGNLFNPYWQVKLIDYDSDEIAFAKGLL